MAINKNHEFEELEGVKCAIVEKNAPAERVDFLRELLTFNRYEVVVVPSPPPKTAPAETTAEDSKPPTFTVGVTDVRFNPVNAIFGRLLRTPDRHVVTLAYWNQKETKARDDLPYFDNQNS